jgi:hypothetical protein
MNQPTCPHWLEVPSRLQEITVYFNSAIMAAKRFQILVRARQGDTLAAECALQRYRGYSFRAFEMIEGLKWTDGQIRTYKSILQGLPSIEFMSKEVVRL